MLEADSLIKARYARTILRVARGADRQTAARLVSGLVGDLPHENEHPEVALLHITAIESFVQLARALNDLGRSTEVLGRRHRCCQCLAARCGRLGGLGLYRALTTLAHRRVMKIRDNMSAVIEGLQRDHGLLAAYLEATDKIDWRALRKRVAITETPALPSSRRQAPVT